MLRCYMMKLLMDWLSDALDVRNASNILIGYPYGTHKNFCVL
jgi:hypothetical protein